MLDQLEIPTSAPHTPSFGWPARLLPSLTDLITLFPVLFVLLKMQGVSTLLGDGDTGWHIRTGEWIIQHGRVPSVDFFSFSKPGQPWFAWEWGWDWCFAWIHRFGGLPAVVFVNLVLLGVIFALLFRLVRRECSNDLVAISVSLLALAGTSLHWLARPHLVTWLFLLIFGHVLSRAARGRLRLLWCLPPLMLIWTNLHGGFFVGIALVLVYSADPIARAISAPRPWDFRPSYPYFICAIACLLVSFVNPYGWSLHQHLISYLLDSKQVENILEFQSINFRHPLARYFEIMLALGTVAAFFGFKRGRITEALLILAWAHLALVSIRNIPIFLLFAAPAVARLAAEWVSQFPRVTAFASEFHLLERIPRLPVATFAAFSLLFALMAGPGEAKAFRSEYDPGKYPAQAVERLRSAHVTRVFTDDEWGDYLIYRMYPAGRVFVDGRSDFYGAEFENRYLELMQVHFDWEQGLAQYGVDTVLLRVDAPLAGALKESPRWQIVYDDGIALIFVRGGAGSSNPLRGKQDFPAQSGTGEKSLILPSAMRKISGNNNSLKGEPQQ
jgi:hypothetical protein